ncbi:sorting nexin-14-like [Mercenaria mercenaria]|uniref:sorting nexin-14-like n=1 Tax=Mercenaria mercenaria TaxID=6596 RepID=UPI00234E4F6F|nr:sorting nexin-14-like [Mercenaria mercenaria]
MAVPLYLIKYYLHKHSKFASFLACLLLATIIFYRFILVTLLLWSFVLGVSVSYCFLSRDFLLPSLLPLFNLRRHRKHGEEVDDEFTLMKTVCTVCGQRKCPRHRPELNILAFQPWTSLEIRQSVDVAFEEFLNIVLNEFVYTWYKDVSTDEEFVDELRTSIRFLFSVLLRRAKKVNVPKMITERLIKAGLQHLHAYMQARATAGDNVDLQEATLQFLGPNLHYAMQSRKAEQEYIRRLVEQMFPYVLRPQALQSKATCALLREILAASVIMPAMDAVANPDMVNNIILVFLDDTPPPPPPETPSPMVSFLANFNNQTRGSLSDPEQTTKVSKSTLRLVLCDVMDPEKPEMLYPFMQFLKSEAAVNVLQFALACEDFNKKILDPDLSTQDLSKLHEDLKELHRNYFSPKSPDRINFEENIVSEVQEIIDGTHFDVLKLRTSTPMFRAYEHVYNLLNKTFLPLFHQSEEYYTMICGERLASQVHNRYVAKQPNKKNSGIASFGSKIKEVFKPADTRSISSLDLLDIENTDDADTVTVASASSLEDEAQFEDLEHTIEQFTPHDLSTWRVTIPRLGARSDPENPKKQFFVFIVEIRRVEYENEGRSSWTVARKYTEFYTLEQKLKEFHGSELDDCVLPPKKIMGTKNQEFIEGKRELFESYLEKLLTKPVLKGSQLLFNFFTAETAFDFGLDINIGRVLKSGARKLVKEKGQHLESFLVGFEKSTEPPKPRPGKQERRDSDASLLSTSSLKLCQTMYENNANGIDRRDHVDGDLFVEMSDVEGIYDSLIYIARFVYHVTDWCHHLLYTARMFVKSTLEAYLDWYTDYKVHMVTQEHRLVSLIHLLRDVLFFDNDPPRTDDDKRKRYEEAVSGCLDFLPKPAVWAIGEKEHREGTLMILHALQQPKLNKQLSYVFLDIFITELFPELMR